MEKKHLIINKEGQADFYIYEVDRGSIPSKSMNVFYNEKMVINRDILNLGALAYRKVYNQENLIIVESMAASGVSSIRLLKECEDIKKIYINDLNPIAVDLIKKNLELNNLKDGAPQIEVSRKDSSFLLTEIAQKFSFNPENERERPNIISIDPFGTPNMYLDSAFKAIQKKDGLLCITATDTAVLFGIRPKACIRKYMSKPLHNEYCKEVGARILLYFISRIANINKLGIKPLCTFYANHFIRVFALIFKDKRKISKDFSKYGYIIHCNSCNHRFASNDNILSIPKECPVCKMSEKMKYAGPLWINNIHDKQFLCKLIELNEQRDLPTKKRTAKILNLALEEIKMPISYYNIHKLCQKLKLSNVPKIEIIINEIKEKGFNASRTHFDYLSIKTDMNIDILKSTLNEIKK